MRALLTIGMVAAFATGAVAQTVELKVGDPAPPFTLQGTDGKTHSLAEHTGRRPVVVAWFPAAFTRGCTIECKSLSENGDQIRTYDVAYFMASVDPIEKNTEFANATSVTLRDTEVTKEAADFPLLSDPNKEVATAYGVLNTRGVASRWTFYIDRDGKIAHIDKTVRPESSAADMVATLAKLRFPMMPR